MAFNFPFLFVLDRVWYQGYAGLTEGVGKYFDFFFLCPLEKSMLRLEFYLP